MYLVMLYVYEITKWDSLYSTDGKYINLPYGFELYMPTKCASIRARITFFAFGQSSGR